MNTAEFLQCLSRGNNSIQGATGVGKSYLLRLMAQAAARDPLQGFTTVCPHGLSRDLAEYMANPLNGCSGRVVHVLQPGSAYSFGLNPFQVDSADDWHACHEASLMWTSSVASLYATAMHETPRLEKTFYVLGMFAAHHELCLLDLLRALSLSGDRIREFLLASFDNEAVYNELADLHELARRQPARFLELTESCRNRLVRWLGDEHLAHIFSRSKGNLDPRAIMNNREICLADLSSLSLEDATFVGTILICEYFAAAKRRPPNVSPVHRLIVDEAADMLCTASAQLLDQTRKYGLLATFSFQRIGQLLAKGEFIADSINVNCRTHVIFGYPEPEGAEYLARVAYTGFLDLQEYKPASARPTPVAQTRVTLRNSSRASHHASSVGTAVSDMRSSGRAIGSTDAEVNAWAAGHSQGNSASFASGPADPFFAPPATLSQNAGHNSGRSIAASGAHSRARSVAHTTAHARSTTTSRARAEGASIAEGQSEALATVYQNLPTQMYSLEEQWHRAIATIMNLEPRECIVKVHGEPPIRTRTPDLAPAFKSDDFKREMLPRFITSSARRSPYLIPADQVDREIAARSKRIFEPEPTPESEFIERLPMIDALEAARKAFEQHPTAPDQASTPGRPAGKAHLRIVDGGKDDGDSRP